MSEAVKVTTRMWFVMDGPTVVQTFYDEKAARSDAWYRAEKEPGRMFRVAESIAGYIGFSGVDTIETLEPLNEQERTP